MRDAKALTLLKVFAAVLLGAIVLTQTNCGSSGSSTGGGASIALVPPSVNLLLGASQQFQAVFTGASGAVTWEVNGVAGGSASVGTVSASGLYTAPSILPSPSEVSVSAVMQSDSQESGSAVVNLTSTIGISVSVSPAAANVPTLGSQVFTATVNGDPGGTVFWSVNGVAGGNSTIGTIVASSTTTAIYTAPAAPPTPASVTVAATSAADTSKSGSATATITCAAGNTLAPSSASVPLAQTQTFTASFCIAPGTAITWDVNGVRGGNASIGTVASSTATSAIYTAPNDLPPSNPVTVHATAPSPSGGAPISAAASVTVTSGVAVHISSTASTLPVGQRASLTASVTGTSDASVSWSVNGIANGNSSLGQICVSGTSPCVAPNGAVAGGVDFLAPAAVPAGNPVSVTATSAADPSRSGSAAITITGTTATIAVAISPAYVFMPPSAGVASRWQFSATVTGSGNANVTWSVQGAVSGQNCTAGACGSVNASGLFTAPSVATSPNAVVVTATSAADSTKSASATVAFTSGPTIETLLPSSAMAGAVAGFPLLIQGVNFVPGSGAAASVILINGVARSTTCSTAGSCTTALAPTDVQTAGALTIQIQNPGNPGALSNPVPLVILPFNVSIGTTPLTAAQPLQTGDDILVTDPTTAAASSSINVASAGPFAAGNCTVGGSPIRVTRPASGTLATSICVFGNGLDPAFAYAFTSAAGIPAGDIRVSASAVPGLFSGLIELDLQITSATAPGVRSLFITTVNNDRAVATGILEVK